MMPEYDKCGRCGRRLKNPESRQLGFGAICYGKLQARRKLRPLFSMEAKNGENNTAGKAEAGKEGH